MEKENIVLVKLFNGEMVIGSKKEDGQIFNITMTNPRAIAIVPTMSGSVRVAMGSVCEPFRVKRLMDEISIPMAQVMFTINEDEIDKELSNGYKSEISGRKIASAADAAAIGSAADGFTL